MKGRRPSTSDEDRTAYAQARQALEAEADSHNP